MARKFRALSERLAELASIPSRIAPVVAEGINTELQREFAEGSDAYGRPWKPLLPSTVKRKGGDTRILMRTDALSMETRARPSRSAGVEISSLPFGQFHQGGTKFMVARKVLPDGGDLPLSWQRVIESAQAAAFAQVMQ